MRPAALLAHLRSLGVAVALEGEHLVLQDAAEVLTADLLDEVRAAKEAIIGLLRREAERPMPCPCGPCTEPGVPAHGPRCYCGPCLDVDPTWEEWRAQADADEAAAKADAAYEVEERLAIQAEGCTAAELEALRNASAAAPQPERWINPDLDAEDRALLRACKRLDELGAPADAPRAKFDWLTRQRRARA